MPSVMEHVQTIYIYIYRLKPFLVVEQLVASVFTWRASTSFISAEVLQPNMGFLTQRKLRKESPQQITFLS